MSHLCTPLIVRLPKCHVLGWQCVPNAISLPWFARFTLPINCLKSAGLTGLTMKYILILPKLAIFTPMPPSNQNILATCITITLHPSMYTYTLYILKVMDVVTPSCKAVQFELRKDMRSTVRRGYHVAVTGYKCAIVHAAFMGSTWLLWGLHVTLTGRLPYVYTR